MFKCVGPELYIKVSTVQEATDLVVESLIDPFYRCILVGSIGTCGVDIETILVQKSSCCRVVPKSAVLIHRDIFFFEFGINIEE